MKNQLLSFSVEKDRTYSSRKKKKEEATRDFQPKIQL